MRIIDLTLPLYTGMPVYPGDPEPSIELVQTVARDGWNMRRIQINSHDGTHVDVPFHSSDSGKSLDDYTLSDFYGPAVIYDAGQGILAGRGVIFRDQNIDVAIAEEIKKAQPRFIGLSARFEFDPEIEKNLLAAGIISFERLANCESLPPEFDFYAMPLAITGGDGSPVRAFALVP